MRKDAFSSGARYTIGYTKDKYLTTNGWNIKYSYKVNGVEYEGSTRHTHNSIVPKGRYWVKFSIDKPSVSKIFQDRPIPSNIESLPPEGVVSLRNR